MRWPVDGAAIGADACRERFHAPVKLQLPAAGLLDQIDVSLLSPRGFDVRREKEGPGLLVVPHVSWGLLAVRQHPM